MVSTPSPRSCTQGGRARAQPHASRPNTGADDPRPAFPDARVPAAALQQAEASVLPLVPPQRSTHAPHQGVLLGGCHPWAGAAVLTQGHTSASSLFSQRCQGRRTPFDREGEEGEKQGNAAWRQPRGGLGLGDEAEGGGGGREPQVQRQELARPPPGHTHGVLMVLVADTALPSSPSTDTWDVPILWPQAPVRL